MVIRNGLVLLGKEGALAHGKNTPESRLEES